MSLRPHDTAAYYMTLRAQFAHANLAALLGGWAAAQPLRTEMADTDGVPPPVEYLCAVAIEAAEALIERLNDAETAGTTPGTSNPSKEAPF